MPDALSIPEQLFDFDPAPEQSAVVELAAKHHVVVLTGGPGTGKTATTLAVIRMFEANGLQVGLCAPTGKAAVRMREQCEGREANTIHSTLGFDGSDWAHNAAEPLPFDALIVDEASMIDVELFEGLLNAVRKGARVVIVGDVNQLPSIGAGRVLDDLIESGELPVVKLTKIFRQASESYIPYFARDINEGNDIDTSTLRVDAGSDVAFAHTDTAQQAKNFILDAVCNLLPAKHGFSPDDIQVLTPVHGGPAGDVELNNALQARLNGGHGRDSVKAGDYTLFQGDRVIHVKNNRQLETANGEIGKVIEANWKGVSYTDPDMKTAGTQIVCVVDYEGRKVGYTKNDVDQLRPAYAITIHKSQGSQFPCIVMPILSDDRGMAFMQTRPLVYTGVTRASKLVVMAGDSAALAKASTNTRGVHRRTTLQECLQAATKEA